MGYSLIDEIKFLKKKVKDLEEEIKKLREDDANLEEGIILVQEQMQKALKTIAESINNA